MSRRKSDLRRYYARVSSRAGHRCEYCHAPETVFPHRFSVDHIKPESAGGATSLANLALCCYGCQQRKFVFELGLDPLSNKPTPLYNPRRQRWFRHFQWSPDYLVLEGLTSVGRATIERLALNNWRQVQARMRWRMHPDIFP